MTAFVNIAAPVVLPHPGLRTGVQYYFSPLITPSATTIGLAPDIAYYQPFILPGMAIDRIGVETAAGAGAARIGFYSNLNGTPDQLILDAGILDISGIAICEISLASAFFMPNAWVWACVICNSTPTVRMGVTGNSWLIGTPNPSLSIYRGLAATQAYGALPAQASVASLVNVSQCPMIMVRKS